MPKRFPTERRSVAYAPSTQVLLVPGTMAALGNFLWFVFGGGLFMGLGWLLAGCLLYITIVGIPFAHACFRIASFAFFPFGKELVDARVVGESPISGTGVANLLWFVLAGVWLAIGHLLASISCIVSCLLIVPIFLGAPAWALAHLNLAKVSLAPLGKRIVSKEMLAGMQRAHL